MKKLKRFLSLALALCIILSVVPFGTFAATTGTKPDSGSTTNEPFPQGTGGSNSFRIPALVTLSDGTLVAAADARWNTTYDGGGLDTIVSVSTDGGKNWTYNFANYLGDNGNEYNGSSSTAFIDPSLVVTADDTIYMLVDLYPYGIALNGSGNTAPSTATGFTNEGYLKLSTDGSNYNYYLKGNTIYSSDGTAVSGYTVDGYFNIKSTDGTVDTNLFFSDSPYKVVRTGFLYLTKSTDKGATWSEPTLLNLKTSSEMVCLVAPGRGLVTSGNMIVFPVYSYNGSQSTQQMSFIYSTDNGASWTRTASFTGASWSSESAVVELSSGNLRFFYRNGSSELCYADYNVSGNAWNGYASTGIYTNSNCQISAITYSGTIDDQQVILVSCPTGPNEAGSDQSGASYRLNGKIFAFKVDDYGAMTQLGSISVTSDNNQFMYSCLTELSDGTVGILYEDCESSWGTGSNCYYTMSYATYDLTADMGLTFDEVENEDIVVDGSENTTNVEINFGSAEVDSDDVTISEKTEISALAGKTFVAYDIEVADFTGTATVTIPLNGKFADDASLVAVYINDAGEIAETIPGIYDTEADTFTFIATHFSTYAVTLADASVTDTVDVVVKVGETSGPYTVNGVNVSTATGLDTTIATAAVVGNAGQAATVTYTAASVSCNTLISSNSTQKATGYYYKSGDNYYPLYATRTGEWSWDSYSYVYTYTWYYTTDNGSTFSQIGTQETTSTSDTPNITVYTKSGTEAVAAYTNVSFTGVKIGTTTALVGTTQYNITVYGDIQITVNYQANGTTVKTETLTVASNAASTTLATSVVGTDGETYKVDNTTLALTAGTTTYNVPVTLVEGTEISIKENETMELAVTLSDGQYVKWSSADSSYVGVAGKYDATAGAYTDTGVIIGQNVTTSPVLVTGTVYNADGTVASTSKWLVTVTEGDGYASNNANIYLEITQIENCTVYYSVNGGELIEVNGTGLWAENGNKTESFNVMFFAAPDDGYALTYMYIESTDNQYYALSNGNPDGTGSSAWPFDSVTQSTIPSSSSDSAWVDGHGFRWCLLEGNMTIEQMKIMFSQAIAFGCDGVTNLTKNSSQTLGSASDPIEMKFVAQKLPTLEKEITSITHNGTTTAYSNGMKVQIGDTITYTVTVTRYATNATYGTITYSNESLTDVLTNNNGITSPDMGTSTTSDKTYTYTTSLTLTTSNFDSVVKNGTITNTAEFSYSYSSQYSTGSLTADASAVAEITVEVPSYVIDFGLPVKFDLSELVTAYGAIANAISENGWGSVAVNGSEVTYTPISTLQGIDYVKLTFANGSYAVAIYPATTVYYEEGFASITNGWTAGSKGTGTQTATPVANDDQYGYDSAYSTIDASNGTQMASEKAGNTATFTFTGTGIDVYANCTTGTGIVAVIIKDSNGAIKKFMQVDTVAKSGGTATSGQDTNLYSLPIVSVNGLDHGTYTVTLVHVGSTVDVTKPVYIDGFRVYGTLAVKDETTNKYVENNQVYVNDYEDNPEYYQLRDYVLSALSVGDSEQYGSLADMVKNVFQVYAGVGTDSEKPAVILNNSSYNDYTSEDVQDLLDNGPKNELFLHGGETLIFKVTTSRELQIGLKAPNAATTVSISGATTDGKSLTIKSSTDMFYALDNTTGTETTYTITITNNGSNILSVTDLKICDDPNASFEALTAEDIELALKAMGYSDVTYADAALTVPVVDYTGKELTSVTLTANGVVGESAVFTAEQILTAVKEALPEGYGLVDESKVADVTVAYGESASASVQAGKTVTLTIKFISARNGKRVDTAEITLVQSSAKNWTRVSAAQIKALAPEGYRAFWMVNMTLVYGKDATIVVPVY